MLTWQDYLDDWRASLLVAGLTPEALVADRPLLRTPEAPEADVRAAAAPDFDWWPREPFAQFSRHLRLQLHYVRHPGTPGPLPSTRSRYKAGGHGTLTTARRLLEAAGDPEMACRVLLAASLHQGHRTPGDPVLTAPLQAAVEALRALSGLDATTGYHHFITATLPAAADQAAGPHRLPRLLAGCPADPAAVARAVIDDQADLLTRFEPVCLRFEGRADPHVWSAVERSFQRRETKAARHRARRARERAARDARLKAVERPDAGWQGIDAEQLTTLVWSKPTMEIAQQFCVSDVAVSKRCKALGVDKPPRGFWAKVNAGKLPHPQGRTPAQTV